MIRILFFTLFVSTTAMHAMASETLERSADGLWERVYQPDSLGLESLSSKANRTGLERANWPYPPLLNQAVYRLDGPGLRSSLSSAESSPESFGRISLPVPGGGFEIFLVTETSVLSPALAAKYPEIRSYRLVSADRPGVFGQADLSPLGFSALLLSPEGSFQVAREPQLQGSLYLSFFESDLPTIDFPVCHANVDGVTVGQRAAKDTASRLMASGLEPGTIEIASGATLREYEVAVATTDDYYLANGNDDGLVLANINSVMTKVDLIMEMEVAVSLVVIPETDQLFNVEYASSGSACALKDENQGVVESILADGDYDIGFAFDDRGTTGGGCASGPVVCDDDNKAEGMAGLTPNPSPDHENFGGYRLVLHEMGHQFGAGHTWSGQSGNCTDDQYSASNAYEPGGGTTLMSYAGTCDSDNILTTTGDPYYHGRSFDQIVTFTTGGGNACADSGNTGNQSPTVDAGVDYTIPTQTPFMLSGTGNDPDGDSLVFTWEQFDLAAGRGPLGVDDGVGPIIRSRIPGPDPSRTIPPWDDILNGTASLGELLPQGDRTLNFRLTARDGLAGGGGVDSDAMVVTVSGDPFFVTSPNGGEGIMGGCPAVVTWMVGGGDVAADVDLMISGDGGGTFQTLLAGTPNDGEQSFDAFSCAPTTQARIMAQASDNIFFDVSDGDFAVLENPPDVSVSMSGGDVDENCEFTLTFEAEVTDDCSVDAADISVAFGQVGDVATIGAPTINMQQVDTQTVAIDGSVLISGLTDSPAQIGIEIDALDGCGFEGDGFMLVEVEDTMPPSIDVSLDPNILWSPNHKMRNITATVEAEDNCDSNPQVVLLSIESNQPENGLGDGDTAPDIDGADLVSEDYEFQVRAERQGGKTDRIYTVTYGSADASSNMAEGEATVRVPANWKTK